MEDSAGNNFHEMSNPYRRDYQPFPQSVRRAALKRAAGRCQLCGRDDVPLQVDHVIPQAAGGPSTLDNAAALCGDCHAVKSAGERAAGIRAAQPARAARHASMTRYIESHPNRPDSTT